MTPTRLNLSDLKVKSPKDLLSMAEELEIENASTMRKGEIMFQILRERADEGWEIAGDGVLEVLQDGFGFLRSPEANYLPGPDDIYVSPDMIRKNSLRTGDTIVGLIKAPQDSERYFALIEAHQINFQDPDKAKHKIAFDNLTQFSNNNLFLKIALIILVFFLSCLSYFLIEKTFRNKKFKFRYIFFYFLKSRKGAMNCVWLVV